MPQALHEAATPYLRQSSQRPGMVRRASKPTFRSSKFSSKGSRIRLPQPAVADTQPLAVQSAIQALLLCQLLPFQNARVAVSAQDVIIAPGHCRTRRSAVLGLFAAYQTCGLQGRAVSCMMADWMSWKLSTAHRGGALGLLATRQTLGCTVMFGH